jgi:hypothetical protein
MPISTPSTQPDDFDYHLNKRSDKIYISRGFREEIFDELIEPRKLRILSKVFDSEGNYEYAKVKKELVLRTTSKKRQEVKVVFYEDNRNIKSITIQRFETKSGNPHKYGFSFSGEEIHKLYNLLRFIKYLPLHKEEKLHMDDELIDDQEIMEYLLKNNQLAKVIVEQHVTDVDIVAFAYRKKQLTLFDQLLNDPNKLNEIKSEWEVRGTEAVWQKFFEANPWIFGYGLNYVFTSHLDNKKLEQVTSGYSFNESGKRVDGLLKTRGIISSLCFVEIKTHTTPLLAKDSYRTESWSISNELSGSIAQIQKTVQKAIKTIQSTKIEFSDDDGNPTDETTFLYQPKSFVVIGSLKDFTHNGKVNEQKYSSFELFRRNLHCPEIITFDELYERAKFIVKSREDEVTLRNEYEYDNEKEDDDEIPF